MSMKIRKEDIISIIFGVILVLIVFFIVFILATTHQTAQLTQNSIQVTPSPIPSQVPEGANPPLTYDKTASNKLLDYFENRRTLSSDDTFAKANILSQLPAGQQSGVIDTTQNYSIDYEHAPDMFQVEILTPNIQDAKNEANVWFREHGLSQVGICTLPVEFYMNRAVAESLRNRNIIFSPLPNGC
jgi:hypothetical protein